MRISLYIVLCLGLLNACSLIENSEFKQRTLARVADVELKEGDLQGFIPSGTSYDDSVKIIKEYVDRWVRKQVMLQKAGTHIDMVNHPEIKKQVEDYKNDLLIYAYESALVANKLDTTVSETELESFYQEFKENFRLKELTLNVSAVAVNKEAPKIDSVSIWMRRPIKYAERLEDYCIQYAHFFSFDSTLWFQYGDLRAQMPAMRIYQPKSTLTYRTYFEREDTVNKYYLKVHKYHLEGEPAPKLMIEDKLRHILLNKRRTNFIDQMHEDLYRKAYKSGQIEIIEAYD